MKFKVGDRVRFKSRQAAEASGDLDFFGKTLVVTTEESDVAQDDHEFRGCVEVKCGEDQWLVDEIGLELAK